MLGATFAILFIATVGLQLTRHAATVTEAQLAAATSAAANLAGPAAAGWPAPIAARQLAAIGLRPLRGDAKSDVFAPGAA